MAQETSRLNYWLLSGAAVLTALTLAPTAQAETLGDALVSAYRNSDLLEQNQAVLRAADEDAASAMTTLRPVISWALQSQYSNNRVGEGTENTLGLNFDWTLYDFGRSRIGIDIARESVLGTREALVGIEQNVLLSAVSAYMDLRKAGQTVDINRTSVNVIGEQLKSAQDRFAVGEITRTDVAQAEAALAAAKAALAAADGSLDVARASYQAAIGHAPDGNTKVPATPPLPKSLAEAQSIAQRLHPSVLMAQHQAKVADMQVELAAAQRRPTIGANVKVLENEFGVDTEVATLALSQPIYAGGQLSSVHRKAIAGRDAARASLTRTGVTITEQVAISWSNIKVASAQISAIDRQIEAAQAAYDGVKEEASLGARTTLDVLDAEQVLLTAQSDRVSAAANLQVANYSLLASMGLLTVEHLKLGIPTYDPEAYYNAVKSAPSTSVQGKSLDRVLKAIGKN